MKHTVWRLALVVALVLSVSAAPVARAADPAPLGGCPTGWHLDHVGDHHDDGQHHQHVGNADQNGDGFLCVKHVTPDGTVHVHMDNVLPN